MSVKQISIFLENSPGRLAEVTGVLERENINIRALSLADTEDFGVLRIIVNDPDSCLAALKANGFVAQVTEVVAVEVADRPGGLAAVLEAFDAEGVNVEYMYAYVTKTKDNAIVICKFDDPRQALDALKRRGIPTLNAEALRAL